jgi:hypothetical protein
MDYRKAEGLISFCQKEIIKFIKLIRIKCIDINLINLIFQKRNEITIRFKKISIIDQ